MASLVLRAQRHGDVAGSLVDRRRPPERPRPEPLQGGAFVDGDLGDPHLVGDEIVVVFGVGGGRLDQLADVVRGAARGELEQRAGLVDVQAADLVGDEPRLARRNPDVAGAGPDDDRDRFLWRLFSARLFWRRLFSPALFFGFFRSFFGRRLFSQQFCPLLFSRLFSALFWRTFLPFFLSGFVFLSGFSSAISTRLPCRCRSGRGRCGSARTRRACGRPSTRR